MQEIVAASVNIRALHLEFVFFLLPAPRVHFYSTERGAAAAETERERERGFYGSWPAVYTGLTSVIHKNKFFPSPQPENINISA